MCLPCHLSDADEMCVYVAHKNGKEAHVSIFYACNLSGVSCILSASSTLAWVTLDRKPFLREGPSRLPKRAHEIDENMNSASN